MNQTTAVEVRGPASPVGTPAAAELGGDGPLSRGAAAWALFEGARNPYVTLLVAGFIGLLFVKGGDRRR